MLNGGKYIAGAGSGTGVNLLACPDRYSISIDGDSSVTFVSESTGTGHEVNVAAL
jgi:hypothetical protein